MNRLPFWADEVDAAAPSAGALNKPKDSAARTRTPAPERLRRSSHAVERHAFFTPLHYEPNYAYPLLIWLPGAGGDHLQLNHVMPHISLRNYAAASVRGAAGEEFNEQGKPCSWRSTSSDTLLAEEAVFEAIDAACGKFHIARHRIFVAGYADGGTMALRLGLRRPECFAAALSLGGRFPTGDGPLARLAAARKLPLFIAQGRDAADYPVETLCDELRLFHAAGMSVTVRQYPCGDELDSQMLHDMDVWMMEHVTGVPHASSAAPTARGASN